MYQPKGDPFFDQLKADIREGIDAADRGETVSAAKVWAQLYARADEIARGKGAEEK